MLVKRCRTVNPDSLRQKVLSLLRKRGTMTTDELSQALRVDRAKIQDALGGLYKYAKVEKLGGGRYRVSERRYVVPPEGLIDIAGPVYQRGYRWSITHD